MFHLCGFKGTLCKNLNMSAPLVITFVSGSGGYEVAAALSARLRAMVMGG